MDQVNMMAGNPNRACKMKTILRSKGCQEFKNVKKRIQEILAKKPTEMSLEDKEILKQYKNLAKLVESQRRYQILRKQRQLEVEDDLITLRKKCSQLVEMIRSSQYVIVYTGAGISTSASIPDYRGPNGVWTRLNAGQNFPSVRDLVFSEPTYTHMAIAELVKRHVVKHVVSQNCDGLHLRSGVPEDKLSEIHGNMYIEVCPTCQMVYTRTFDVTERTALRRHQTGRHCHHCPANQGKLIDTIVHFGEKGKLCRPLNWEAASQSAMAADLIICLGSSLKILRQYACLWPKNNNNRPKTKLAIINLQWTPKDSQAAVKINGKCDQVMQELMKMLDISVQSYQRSQDYIYLSHQPLRAGEEETCKNRTRLEELVNDHRQTDPPMMTPSWFGLGVRKK